MWYNTGMEFIKLFFGLSLLFSLNTLAASYGHKSFTKAPVKCEFFTEATKIETSVKIINNTEYIEISVVESNRTYQVYYKILARDKQHTEGLYMEKVTAVRVYFSNNERLYNSSLGFLREGHLEGYFPFTDVYGKAGSISFFPANRFQAIFHKDLINCSKSF